jgi:hypothetical protein
VFILYIVSCSLMLWEHCSQYRLHINNLCQWLDVSSHQSCKKSGCLLYFFRVVSGLCEQSIELPFM